MIGIKLAVLNYNQVMKAEFSERVQKISINAGFTCPNRDGSKGEGGCTYCNNQTFSPEYCKPTKSVTQQIKEGIEFHNTWNYNPDGTFETFSQGRGQAMTGEYRVKQLNGNWVDVTYTFDEDGQSYTSLYLIENGMMIENHFEDIKIVRNVIPDFPS